MTKNTDVIQAVLHYLVREPLISSDHPPLLFLLHGVGSNEKDLFSFAHQLPDEYLVISVQAPIYLGGQGYAWYQVDFSTGKPVFNFQQAQESKVKLLQFITEIQTKYALHKSDVYVCGFSQGAIMSYTLGLTQPQLVTGIAVMSGRLLEEIKPMIASDEKLQHLKVFMAHGVNDTVLSVEYARQGLAYLESLHIHPTYKEYPVGHTINSEMLTDLIHWLKNSK